MIAGSKGLNPYELAHSWGLLTPTSIATMYHKNKDIEIMYVESIK